jgi:heme-degrading monooxygenase HmoA
MSVTDQLNRSITLINVFTVTPEKHNTAADKIAHIYKTFVCHQPGFISATIQKSLDGAKVAAVAQWESQAALDLLGNRG